MKVLYQHPDGTKEEQEIHGVDPMDQLFFHHRQITMYVKGQDIILSVDIGKRHNHKPVPYEFVVRVGERPKDAIKRLRKEVENGTKKENIRAAR